MIVIKRSQAEELYFKRYEIQVKNSSHSAWETKHYADYESEAIARAEWAEKFCVFEVRILDNHS